MATTAVLELETFWTPSLERAGLVPGLASPLSRSSAAACMAVGQRSRESGERVNGPLGRCSGCLTREVRTKVDGVVTSNLSRHGRKCDRCRGIGAEDRRR